MNAFHILLRKETIGTNLLRYINICIFQVPEVNPNAELILPPCPISQQESNWPLLAVSKGFFEGAMIKGNQPPSATTGLTSNITTKLAANVHIDETGTSGGDWADDDVQVELDEDDINKGNVHNNQDEQGEGWGDSEIELPPDLVSHFIFSK